VARPDVGDSLAMTGVSAPTITMSAIPPAPGLGDRLRSILSLDIRSLALFRIAIGTCLLFDLASRLPDIDAFYTDAGILPREAVIGPMGSPWTLSIHLMSGQWAVQVALFLMAIVFALGMTVGYRTRLCTAVSWFLLSSMQARNPMIGHGGDTLLRVLLFWSMFVPLNGRFSLDQALNPSGPKLPVAHMSWGSQALMLQLCFVYWFTAAAKLDPTWLGQGSAIYYALSLDQFTRPFGYFLLGFPGLLRQLTRGTVLLEALGPLLVFSPIWTGPLRLVMVLVFIGFHAGVGLSMYLGNFSWVCAAAWLMFLPPLVWHRLERWAAVRSQGVTIYFDADCSFCRKGVLVLRELLLLIGSEIREAQGEPAMEALMRARNSWIVRDPEGGVHSGFDAFVALSRYSVLTMWLAGTLGSAPARWVGERMYRWVATRRSQMSRLLSWLTPPPPRERVGVIANAIVLICLPLVFAWNLANFPANAITIPTLGRRIVSLAGLRQSWGMFAPYPATEDGWFLIEGVRADGSRVDLWRGNGVPTEGKPRDVAATYRDARWRKYLTNIWLAKNHDYRQYFGRYLCRTWNEQHRGPDRVRLVDIGYMLETTPPPGNNLPQPQKVQLWWGRCTENASGP
jgi:predicted DCC family thiol-disulfide oxidoreductase YuxK